MFFQKFLFSIILITLAPSLSGEIGVSENEIIIGMSNAMNGPAQNLGQDLTAGAKVYFQRINDEGGIFGRKIRLINYDDGYEPKYTSKNTKLLLEKDKVFALFGFVGTPTSKAAVPIATSGKVPYLAPFTGAEFLRRPLEYFVINIRASYLDETAALVEYFSKNGINKIGILIQDDGYGDAGKAGIIKALRTKDLEVVGEGRFKRNTLEVEDGVAVLEQAKPQAVIMIGTYGACGKAIQMLRTSQVLKDIKIANISFVGTTGLIEASKEFGEGTLISQVMPSPEFSTLPIVEQYKTDMQAANAKISYTSLEGYIDAFVTCEAIKRAGKNLSRVNLIEAFEGMHTNLLGLDLNFSTANHQGLTNVYITQIQNGKPIEIK